MKFVSRSRPQPQRPQTQTKSKRGDSRSGTILRERDKNKTPTGVVMFDDVHTRFPQKPQSASQSPRHFTTHSGESVRVGHILP